VSGDDGRGASGWDSTGWEAFWSARDRFLAVVRPEAMSRPPRSPCPDAPPAGWGGEATSGDAAPGPPGPTP
jgi:hypothetical protein